MSTFQRGVVNRSLESQFHSGRAFRRMFFFVPVPQRVFRFREETAEAVKWAPRGRVQQLRKRPSRAVRLVPRERVKQRTAEQMVRGVLRHVHQQGSALGWVTCHRKRNNNMVLPHWERGLAVDTQSLVTVTSALAPAAPSPSAAEPQNALKEEVEQGGVAEAKEEPEKTKRKKAAPDSRGLSCSGFWRGPA